jgi:uncharacterized protein
MLRVVFDTVVFVRALLNPHGRWGRLLYQYAGAYRLFLSRPVVEEILEVIHRPEITRKAASFGRLDLQRMLATLGQAEIVELGQVPAVSRDPTDDMFLATARAAAAEYLVSEDQDLLVLSEYEGTRIVDCATFLELLERA